MFHYTPPKSSIWGHKLRKMEASRQRELLEQFLQRAAVEPKYELGTVFIPLVTWPGVPLAKPFTELVERFARELGGRRTSSYFEGHNLTEQQFDECFKALTAAGALDGANPACARLMQMIAIPQWRIGGREVPTLSQMHVHYGPRPCISTFFTFETMEEYRHIQSTMSELGICKLSDKHLKPMKSRGQK